MKVKIKSFSLNPEESEWVEGWAETIRRQSGLKFGQSELVRGILAGLKAAGVEFNGAETEEDVRRLILDSVRRGR